MMAVEIMIARQLTYFAAREKDAGRRCDLEAGMAKLLGGAVAWATADNALQIHGGNGFALEYPISRVLCDARILSIFEGAAEIQAQVIAAAAEAAASCWQRRGAFRAHGVRHAQLTPSMCMTDAQSGTAAPYVAKGRLTLGGVLPQPRKSTDFRLDRRHAPLARAAGRVSRGRALAGDAASRGRSRSVPAPARDIGRLGR